MLETAVALAFGHFLADFLLQTNAMVREKARPGVLLLHVGIVVGLSWLALGFALRPGLLLLIATTHYAFDWLKGRYGGQTFGPFALDQAGHLAIIALAATLYPGAYAAGLWGLPAPGPLAAWLAHLPAALALATGTIAAVWAGGYAVQALMHGLKIPGDPETDASLPQGGRLIGRLERLMILMLIIAGQPDAVGFLIAAKSILRFNELARGSDRHASEYVIIGTLASFAWGLGAAYAVKAVLAALGAP